MPNKDFLGFQACDRALETENKKKLIFAYWKSETNIFTLPTRKDI